MRRIVFVALIAAVLASLAAPALADDREPWAGGAKSRRGTPEVAEDGLAAVGVDAPAATSQLGADLCVYMWTNIARTNTQIESQGWTSGSDYIYWVRNKNYLCKRSSCTRWSREAAYQVRWLWTGWTWNARSWTRWYTLTSHSFKFFSYSAISTQITERMVRF